MAGPRSNRAVPSLRFRGPTARKWGLIKGLDFHASLIARNTVIESYATGRLCDPHTNKSLREFPNMASAGTANGRQGAARGGGRAASSCENLKNYEHRIHFYDRFEMARARSLHGVINFQRYTIMRK